MEFAPLMDFIQGNVAYAPFAIFGLLLLAGFNLPVSEDAMIFISAILASQNPDSSTPLFLGAFLGAYFSDLICYAFLGRYLGKKIFKISFFAKMVSQERIEKVNLFYSKYGITTLILGRFIPFGVRNALFFTAGLGRMNALKFALADLLACTISTSTFFWLYYHYGESVITYIKKGNMIIFGAFILALSGYMVRRKMLQKGPK
jgi:membrane-associated protein